jgi:crotonobetainyl-CoA:carnitine CoA-transferase CaiB-like acyl-CoA transferase
MSARIAHRPELEKVVGTAIGRLALPQAVALLESAGIAFAHLTPVEELARHPQLVERGRWQPVQTPVGSVPALLPPGVPRGGEPRMDAVPELGGSNDAVLAWLGYSAEDVARLQGAGLCG